MRYMMTRLCGRARGLAILLTAAACARQTPVPADQQSGQHSARAAENATQDSAKIGFVDRRAEISPTPEEVTVRLFTILHGEIRKVRTLTGALPASLEAILRREEPDPNLRPRRQWLQDGWETPFRYVRTGDSYELISAGPDRQFGTADDRVSSQP